MEKIAIITLDKIDSTIQKVLGSSENYELDIIKINEINKINQKSFSLAIIDISSGNLDDIIKHFDLSTSILICSDNKNLDYDLKNREFDIIFKPLIEKELDIRVSNLLKLQILKNEINRITVCDDLTGLFNRNYLLTRLEEELSRAVRHNTPISCIFIDIDYFKVVNDMYGYHEGDEVLKKIATILKKHIRKEDIVTRYGDEEFVIALPTTNDKNAYVIAERIRKDIKSNKFFNEDDPMNVTVSIGISVYPFPHMEPDVNTLIRYAEHALYNSKKQGKNKVVLFSQINFEF